MNILMCTWTSILEPHCIQAFKNMGHNVTCINAAFDKSDCDKTVLNQVNEILSKNLITLVFSINFIPLVSKLCNIYHIPYVSYVVDSPAPHLNSRALRNNCNYVFIFDKCLTNKYSERNPGHIFHLTLPGNCDIIKNMESVQETYEDSSKNLSRHTSQDVAFVGSLYDQVDISSLSPYIKGYIDGLINSQINVYGYTFLEDALDEDFIKRFKVEMPFQTYDDYQVSDKALISDFYLDTLCTHVYRTRALSKVSEHFNTFLYTKDTNIDIKHINLMGPVDPLTEAPYVYQNTKINLNLTYRGIESGIPLRIYDIMSCKGFVLSNYQREIPEIFESDKDLVLFENELEMLDKIKYYLNHDDIRLEIANNGFEKVKKYHSYQTKLQIILDAVMGR